mgnify:CR=1 FL=1
MPGIALDGPAGNGSIVSTIDSLSPGHIAEVGDPFASICLFVCSTELLIEVSAQPARQDEEPDESAECEIFIRPPTRQHQPRFSIFPMPGNGKCTT